MPRLRPAPKKEEIEEVPEVKLHENEPEKPVEFEVPEKKEPVVEVEEPESKEDPALALQKQLDELKKSEELQRTHNERLARERDEALKRAQEREVEVTKLQQENTQSSYDQISSALAAAQAEAERAAQDVEVAGNASDFKALADAQRRLARAETRIDKLEDGKFELEARVKAEKAAPKIETTPHQPTIEQAIDSWNLPEITTRYLKANQEYVRDPVKFDSLKYWNRKAAKAGLELHTQAFLDYVDERMKQEDVPPKTESKVELQQRTNIVSAPVSREVPSGGTGSRPNGKVTLTAEQKEFARISGVTETEYAKQLLKYQEMKANGQYSDGRQ